MEGLWAIIPVKPFNSGKTRLSSVLNIIERKKLSKTMLDNALKAITDSQEVEQLIVVSNDSEVLTIAKKKHSIPLKEINPLNLNNAIASSVSYIIKNGGTKILVLPSDLPLISANDINNLVSLAENPPVMVISSDRRETGTNALLLNPISKFQFNYGEESFIQHTREARTLGYRVELCNNINISLDLDLPEDLELYYQMMK